MYSWTNYLQILPRYRRFVATCSFRWTAKTAF